MLQKAFCPRPSNTFRHMYSCRYVTNNLEWIVFVFLTCALQPPHILSTVCVSPSPSPSPTFCLPSRPTVLYTTVVLRSTDNARYGIVRKCAVLPWNGGMNYLPIAIYQIYTFSVKQVSLSYSYLNTRARKCTPHDCDALQAQ